MEPYLTGGRDSFVAALIFSAIAIIIVLLKSRGDKKPPLKEQILNWVEENTVTKGLLLFVAFIALWIAIRAIGFNFRVFLFEEEHSYTAFEVLDIIAFVLTLNLCLTLLRASSGKLREITSATFQSVLIALILFLPRAVSEQTNAWFGQYGAAVLMVGFAGLLASLGYITKHTFES